MNASATLSRMLKPAAVAMATVAALFAFAFAAPSNASAYEITTNEINNAITLNNETNVSWAAIMADPKMKYAETNDFIIKITGTCSFADAVSGTNVSVVNAGSDPAKVTFNKGIQASEDLDISNKTGLGFTITVKEDSAAAAESESYSPVRAGGNVWIQDATLTATGGSAAIYATQEAFILRSNVTATGKIFGIIAACVNFSASTVACKGSKSGVAASGLDLTSHSKLTATSTKTKNFDSNDAGITCESIYAEDSSEITATGVIHGVYATNDVYLENSTMTAKATASGTSKTEAKLKQQIAGLYAEGQVSLFCATLKCYAYASSLKFASTSLGSSAAIMAREVVCQGVDTGSTYLYASNTGKYGIGIFAAYLDSSADSNMKSSIKAYAKNRGAGIYLMSEGAECYNTNVTAYGGKYAIRSLSHLGHVGFTGGNVYAYAKNKYGTRTGSGIVSDGYVFFNNVNLAKVYAKKTSSYYGIKGKLVVIEGNTTAKVYAYKTKAIKSTAADAVWYPAPSKVYINGVKKKNTGEPDFS